MKIKSQIKKLCSQVYTGTWGMKLLVETRIAMAESIFVVQKITLAAALPRSVSALEFPEERKKVEYDKMTRMIEGPTKYFIRKLLFL